MLGTFKFSLILVRLVLSVLQRFEIDKLHCHNPNFVGRFHGTSLLFISKTYMTRVERENRRVRQYLARLHRKSLCKSKVGGNVEVFCRFTDSLSWLERYSSSLSFIAQLTNTKELIVNTEGKNDCKQSSSMIGIAVSEFDPKVVKNIIGGIANSITRTN